MTEAQIRALLRAAATLTDLVHMLPHTLRVEPDDPEVQKLVKAAMDLDEATAPLASMTTGAFLEGGGRQPESAMTDDREALLEEVTRLRAEVDRLTLAPETVAWLRMGADLGCPDPFFDLADLTGEAQRYSLAGCPNLPEEG